MTKRAVLFDLDGTVLASKEGIFRSASYALNRLSMSMPSEMEMLAFLGPPLAEGFGKVCHVPAEQIDDAIRYYREYYNNGGMFEAYIYEGIDSCLESLRKHGVKTYITTSKPRVYAEKILKRFDMDKAFDAIYGCELDGTRSHKSEVVAYCLADNDLSSSEVLLVGDRHFDVYGAAECGVDCVGVTYGYGTERELRDAGTAYIAKTTRELQQLLESLC